MRQSGISSQRHKREQSVNLVQAASGKRYDDTPLNRGLSLSKIERKEPSDLIQVFQIDGKNDHKGVGYKTHIIQNAVKNRAHGTSTLTTTKTTHWSFHFGSTERFVVLDYAHRSLVQVLSAVESGVAAVGSLEHCFNLTLLENHQGRMMERLLRAPSQSDMHRWMAAFPNPTNPDQHEEEVIYEDWDCPQVQCVEQYVAQQADELALEPTDIVNVTRKTEGCYEGIRLSDGQKGWFPAANVMEITNEHVRRRNLRERYRVMQAASVVASNKANTSH